MAGDESERSMKERHGGKHSRDSSGHVIVSRPIHEYGLVGGVLHCVTGTEPFRLYV